MTNLGEEFSELCCSAALDLRKCAGWNVLALGQLSPCWRTGLDLTPSAPFLGFNTSISRSFFRIMECPELEGTQRIIKVQLLSLHRAPQQSHPVLLRAVLCRASSWTLMNFWPLGGGLLAQSEGWHLWSQPLSAGGQAVSSELASQWQSSRLSASSRFSFKVWSHPAQIKHRFLKFMSSIKIVSNFICLHLGPFLQHPWCFKVPLEARILWVFGS